MNVGIFVVLSAIVLLSSESNKSIIVNENCHGWNNTSYEHINSKIIFMTIQQRWPFYVFLNNILILGPIYSSVIKSIFLCLSRWICIHLLCLYTLLNFQKLVHFFSIFLSFFVQWLSKLFNFLMDENTSTLTSTFRFADENDGRVFFTFSFCHYSWLYLFLSFWFFLLCVFLNIVEFCWIHPGFGKEVKMIRELFLKSL